MNMFVFALVEQVKTQNPAAMAVDRRLLLRLGYLGSFFVIMLYFYGWDKLQHSKSVERMHQLQEQRKQQLKDICSADKEALSEGKCSVTDMSAEELKNLLVDDTHGIIYCYIPKVACSNWKKVMFVLKQSEPYRDPMSVSDDLIEPTDKHLTLLKSFPRTEMMAKLKHYTKFLFVRDPFVRIISAYRDKLQRPNKLFLENFALDIIRRYGNQSDPPRSVDEAFASGLSPSFHNFIQYLVDPKTENSGPFEPHWRQMHRLCHPCHIQYDFIGHQETLQEDAEQLMKLLMLKGYIKFPPSYVNMTSSNSVLDWFRTVPVEDRRKLYKLYESDFRLFGYRKPDELLDGFEVMATSQQ
ncbi:carbohydrate sulfotransferase 12 isoform X1 [Scophthalmus maximus]|uniref:carbohydrate sulfotransferase 12 isoform X1 n=2 Tax=Scophthalmus maximus TaxID=52904 RepID=UPI001FA935C9|nr:carbohydrate sulfotransferase 12 isoform X1 [Scophthalmus maximus]